MIRGSTMTEPSPAVWGGSPTPAVWRGGPAQTKHVIQSVIKINGYGEFSGLLHSSPHGVLYEGKQYPTALHLFEARKFLPHRHDLADRIRQSERVEEVTSISAEHVDSIRRDWGNIMLSVVSKYSLSLEPRLGKGSFLAD